MHPIARNFLAVLLGLVLGSMVNMALVMVSGHIIPPPEGADTSTMEGLQAAIPLFEPKHFIFPFLAHALGVVVAAYLVTVIAASRHFVLAMTAGGIFLLGGIANVMMLPSPMWFNVLDLVGAYIPMAWIGWRIGRKLDEPKEGADNISG